MGWNLPGRQVCFGIILIGVVTCPALIPGGYSYAQSPKEARGLHFPVPEDWPIEKRGGVVAPIPTEEYITIKFKVIEEEFRAVKDELSEKFNGLRSDFERMEKEFSEGIKDVRSQMERQAGARESSEDILSNLKSLESELGRLDRKITNKTLEMQSRFEEMNRQIKSFEKDIAALQTQIYKLDEEVDYIGEKQGSSY